MPDDLLSRPGYPLPLNRDASGSQTPAVIPGPSFLERIAAALFAARWQKVAAKTPRQYAIEAERAVAGARALLEALKR